MGARSVGSPRYASRRQVLSLYIHCKLGQAAVWSPLFAAMGKVHPTVELPGHGRAPDWDPQQDYQTQARDLTLAALSEPAHLVGHSYGATVALRVAVDRPDLVRSLTLIEPVFFKAAFEVDPLEKRAYVDQAAPFHAAWNAGDAAGAAQLFTDHWGGLPWAMMRPEQREYITKRIPLILAAEPSIFDDNADTWPRIKTLEQPVLLLEGAKSPTVISKIQQSLLKALPNAVREVIEGADHMGPITVPQPYAERILTFQESN